MGQTHGLPQNVCLDDFLNDLHAFYPGFEEQLEHAYRACTGTDGDEDTVEDEGMRYAQVEPVMRHFLYQMGLGEMLPRVCDSDGRLKLTEINTMLHTAGVHLDTHKTLNCDDWKILIVAWVRRLQEEQAADLDRWHGHLNKMQYEQEQKFDCLHKVYTSLQTALRAFQSTYIDQIEAYHKAVEDHHTKEEALRREWEGHQEVQDRFYESQQEYLTRMNEMAERNFAGRTVQSQQEEFVSKVKTEAQKINRVPFSGANKCFSFVYPVDMTAVGAPVSGGSVMPHRARKTRQSAQ